MPEARANGASLYYEEHGSGEAIVGLHGAGSSAAFWNDAAHELATRGRTIVYDRRGHFQSERAEPYATDVHEQADDAAALIDVLGAAPAIVIGRSYGGATVIDLALRHPDRVRAWCSWKETVGCRATRRSIGRSWRANAGISIDAASTLPR